MSKKKYDAFISYSHSLDGKLAPAVQHALHRIAKPWYKLRALNVFRDETNLSVAPELWGTIEAALFQSRYLILMVSPAAAKSKWVKKEVEWWLNHNSANTILIALTEGEVIWKDSIGDFDWESSSALNPILKGQYTMEPLYVDLRGFHSEEDLSLTNPVFKNKAAIIAASLHGQTPAELIGEDIRQYRATIAIRNIVLSVITILLLGVLIFGWLSNRNAKRARSTLADQRAFSAFSNWNIEPSNAFLFAWEALQTVPESDPRKITYDRMAQSLIKYLPEQVINLEAGISKAAFSAALEKIVINPMDSLPYITNLSQHKPERVNLEKYGSFLDYKDFTFSPDGNLVAGLLQPFMSPGKDVTVLCVWDSYSGDIVSCDSLDFMDGNMSVNIVGFLGGNGFLLVETSRFNNDFNGFQGILLRSDDISSGALGIKWHSNNRFSFGRVNLDAGIIISNKKENSNGGSIGIFNLVNGKSIFTDSSGLNQLPHGGNLKYFLSGQGKAFAVAEFDSINNNWITKTWMLDKNQLKLQRGPIISIKEPKFMDLSNDGKSLLVLLEDEFYPAEIWDFQQLVRSTIPVPNSITYPFVMKGKDEFHPLSFIAEDSLILARYTHTQSQMQHFEVYDKRLMRLVADPLKFSLDYIALRPDLYKTNFVSVKQNGILEKWNLIKQKLPEPIRLPISNFLHDAYFIENGNMIVTSMKVNQAKDKQNYVKICFWNSRTLQEIKSIPEKFPFPFEHNLSLDFSHLITLSAGKNDGTYVLKNWNLNPVFQEWSQMINSKIYDISFRMDGSEIVAAGESNKSVFVIVFDAQTGNSKDTVFLDIPTGSAHLSFSRDGEHLIADYNYSTIMIWSLEENRMTTPELVFSDAGGMPFNLGYDILCAITDIKTQQDGRIKGKLHPDIDVKILFSEPGISIQQEDMETPLFSHFNQENIRLYPIRGSELVSSSGNLFALGTNSTASERASAIRVYDLFSGYPLTGQLLHKNENRPGEQWPTLLSSNSFDLDPIIAIHFSEDDKYLYTLTLNGYIRKWPIGVPGQTLLNANKELASALTGKQLIGANYFKRIPSSTLRKYQKKLCEEIIKWNQK